MGLGTPNGAEDPWSDPRWELGTPNGAENPWRDPKWELGTNGRTQNGAEDPRSDPNWAWGPQMGPRTPGGTQNGTKGTRNGGEGTPAGPHLAALVSLHAGLDVCVVLLEQVVIGDLQLHQLPPAGTVSQPWGGVPTRAPPPPARDPPNPPRDPPLAHFSSVAPWRSTRSAVSRLATCSRSWSSCTLCAAAASSSARHRSAAACALRGQGGQRHHGAPNGTQWYPMAP